MSSEDTSKNLDESIFNTSTKTTRTPPAANAKAMDNLTKKPVVCNICNETDSKLKVICHNCETTHHIACLPESESDASRTVDWCCNKCTEALARSQKGSRGSERLKARALQGSSSSLATERTIKAPMSNLNVNKASTSSLRGLSTQPMTRMVTTTITTTTSTAPMVSINKTSLLANTMFDVTLIGASNMQPLSESTTRQPRSSKGGSSTSSSRRRTADKLQALKEEHYFRQQRIAAEAEAETQRQEAAAKRKENELTAKAKLLADEEEYQRKCREVIEEGSRRGSQASSTVNSSIKDMSISDWVAKQTTSVPAGNEEEVQKSAEEANREQELVEEDHRRKLTMQLLLRVEQEKAHLEAQCLENSRREEARRAEMLRAEVQRAEEQRVKIQRHEEERRQAARQQEEDAQQANEERERREKQIERSRQELARWESLTKQKRQKEEWEEKQRREYERVQEEVRRELQRGEEAREDKRRADERLQEKALRDKQRGEEAHNKTDDANNSTLRSRHLQDDLWSQLPWLNRNVTEDEFLDSTLRGGSSQFRDSLLTKSQIQARHVIPKELPHFTGDPKEWPQFITTFAHSTHQCGFTAEENIARLRNCLKGDAYKAVRTDLLLPSSLPIVLNTLRRLYGRPHVILEAAEEELRQAPVVKLERFETIVMLALKVNSYCNTLKAAGMKEHLNNRALLRDVVQKLPAMFKLEWGRHRLNEEKVNSVITMEHFNIWISATADVAGCLADEPVGVFSSSASIKRTSRTVKSDFFHAAHEIPATEEINTRQTSANIVDTKEIRCPFCGKGGHAPEKCRKFINLHPAKRWAKVKRSNVCVSCLGNHWIRDCPKRNVCGVNGCHEPHHALLHSQRQNSDMSSGQEEEESRPSATSVRNVQQTREEPGTSTARSAEHINAHSKTPSLRAYYQVVPVTLYGSGQRSTETFAFLDSGSTVTLLEEGIASELGLEGATESLTLKWTNDVTREEDQSRRVSLNIAGRHSNTKFKMENVRTTRKLELPSQTITEENLSSYAHLRNLKIPIYTNMQPRILIGLDNHHLLTHQNVVEGSWTEPAAVRTRLGWSLLGGARRAATTNARINCHVEADNQLQELVQSFFALESLGVKVPNQEVESLKDTRARKIMHDTVKLLPEGRFEAGLLWKDDGIRFPNSRKMAMHRLLSFERKLQRDPILARAVSNLIEEYQRLKFLIKLTREEAQIQTDRTWYLPVFAVKNPNKPAKTRLVWDAAATVDGVSLNTELLTGPDLLENLVGVLMRFREHKYGVSADIQQMFHQVQIRSEDQDAQRCLWRNAKTREVETFKMAVMTFGAACSPSTAQFVKNLNADRFKHKYPRAVEAIYHRHYVDDYIDSFATEDECIEVSQRVINIHAKGGFVLRNFVSNSPKILQALTGSRNEEEKTFADTGTSTTVLGMLWRMTQDELCFRVNTERIGETMLQVMRPPTKREVLRLLMMIFDPIGLLAFYILQGKLVLKDVWRSKIEWDDSIKDDQLLKWTDWIMALRVIETVKIPRCYFPSGQNSVYELHVMVDASEKAAAAVIYIVCVDDEQRNVAFATSKTKIAPNKPISIPRMELQAAVMGARLAVTVRKHQTFQFLRTVYWSDSRNVLCWLRSPKSFKPFVAHRVGEILELSDSKEWRWVPTAENVADEATKWKIKPNYCVPHRWFEGPQFLQRRSEEWPKELGLSPEPSDEEQEVRCLHIRADSRLNYLLPDISRFGKLDKLLRVTVYALRFFYRRKPKESITPEEINEARIYVVRAVQQDAFGDDWDDLKQGGLISTGSKLRKLSPFMGEDNIIRMRSRLREAEYLTYDQRCPIILPQKHRFTELLIAQAHERYYHQFHGTVINELRQRYHIPKLRSQLLKVQRSCMRCRIRDSRPEVPEMAALPRSRMAARIRPFTHVGVDYFGPMLIKIGRRQEKRWGVLFTCLTVRAIHLELAASLSADSFILMLRAFIARRGMPREVYCDNGTNFRGANTELRKTLQHNIALKVRESYAEIAWKFNPPAAPHMGGAWERLIRSVKNGLTHALPTRTPTEELLRCCLVEIEGVVNSRPLTYVETSKDSLESLTPNHFLLGCSSGVKPFGAFTDEVHVLRSEWKQQQRVVQVFWTRWVAEYLPTISARTKWYDPVQPLKIGDVVAVVDSQVPYSWKLGRITEVISSSDGNIRQAEVRTNSGTLRRPASKLAVLIRDDEKLSQRVCDVTGGSVADGSPAIGLQ